MVRNKLFDELQPVPTMFLQGSSRDTVADDVDIDQAASKPAIIETTERFFQLMCQYLKRNSKSAFDELLEIIEDESLPSASKEINSSLSDWVNSGLQKIDLSSKLDLPVCQALSHDLYVLITEVAGPVEADLIINRVIDDLLKSDLAQQFNPRDLL